MCHWILRVWQCGDSFFTKHSSCSFDRAAHNPNNPLNPLHPSITPFAQEGRVSPPRSDNAGSPAAGSSAIKGNVREAIKGKRIDKPETTTGKQSRGLEVNLYRPAMAAIDDGAPKDARGAPGSDGTGTACPRSGTGDGNSTVPPSEVGKASRFSDRTLAESLQKCQVFEVVLQSKETTMCPSCARSPRRAALPAHARGCFAFS